MLFFNSNEILKISDGIETAGSFNWEVTVCLLAAWVLVYLCTAKGIKSSGKVRNALINVVLAQRCPLIVHVVIMILNLI